MFKSLLVLFFKPYVQRDAGKASAVNRAGKKQAVGSDRPLTRTQKPRNVIPSEARNLALRQTDRPDKASARFLASLGMTAHFRGVKWNGDDCGDVRI